MSDTRLDLPAVRAPGRGQRPFWLAPLCTLIVASPFALAAGAGAAWLTAGDPTLPVVQAGPQPDLPFPVATTTAPPPSSTYSEPAETAAPVETTRRAPRTVTRWRTPDPVEPPPRPAAPTTTELPPVTGTPEPSTTTGAPSTTPDESSAGATQTPGSTP